jgi:cytidylate kinase
MPTESIVIAIDGPSGVGKSTIAARVAQELDLPYLETGAMYRALGWQSLKKGIDPTDREAVEELARGLDLELAEAGGSRATVLLDGMSLDSTIRTPAVSEATSHASSHPGVRREMVERQRKFANQRGAVLEGRDIGTRVFPDTPYKFFLTAPREVRVARRLKQLEAAGRYPLDRETIDAEVAARDQRDQQREESPLMVDDTYIVLDTGDLSIDEAVERIVASVG